MSTKITEAVYRKNGKKLGVLTPDDIDEISYIKEYKGNLYCPHPGCAAQLFFVDGYIQTKHLRSFPLPRGQHILRCQYEVNHSIESKPRKPIDPEYKYRISDDHISAVLRRAYLHHVEGKELPSHGENTSNKKTKTSHPSYLDSNLPSDGTGEQFQYLDEKNSGREQKIPIVPIEELTDSADKKKLCLIGKVSHVYLDEEFAYINFITKYKNKIKIEANVCFSYRFIVLNEVQFVYLKYVKDFVDILRKDKQPIFCCCIGEITKNKSGTFSVHPDRYTAFSINNKKLYAIIHEMNPDF